MNIIFRELSVNGVRLDDRFIQRPQIVADVLNQTGGMGEMVGKAADSRLFLFYEIGARLWRCEFIKRGFGKRGMSKRLA